MIISLVVVSELREVIGKTVSGVGYYASDMIVAFTDGSILHLIGDNDVVQVDPSSIDTGVEDVGYALEAAGILSETQREQHHAEWMARIRTERQKREEVLERREYERLCEKYGKASADLWTKK